MEAREGEGLGVIRARRWRGREGEGLGVIGGRRWRREREKVLSRGGREGERRDGKGNERKKRRGKVEGVGREMEHGGSMQNVCVCVCV